MIYLLDEFDFPFPDPKGVPQCKWEPDGMIALGGDLSPERLVAAYSVGAFPWTSFRDLDVPPAKPRTWLNMLRWYCPYDRFVIFPGEIHVSHSMRTLMNSGKYECTFDTDFSHVISGCSQLRIMMDGAWLGPQMVEAYTRLHRMGVAHSVEVWWKDALVGGLYGVALGNAFFGESMFSLAPSASKLALIALSEHMKQRGGALIDCQFETPHLLSMGGRHIPYPEYRALLRPAPSIF